jgi:hypothetical protein
MRRRSYMSEFKKIYSCNTDALEGNIQINREIDIRKCSGTASSINVIVNNANSLKTYAKGSQYYRNT